MGVSGDRNSMASEVSGATVLRSQPEELSLRTREPREPEATEELAVNEDSLKVRRNG